ncbi:hypothetical protein BHM03_00041412 [Ensete ventricosum]|nr:hypothetical protein BHM03_00041412 [Ensete ventricosum]
MQWEFAGSLPGVRRELTEGIKDLPGVRQKLAEGIISLLGVHRELAKMTSGVRRKKTKRLAERSSGVAEKDCRESRGSCWTWWSH